MMHEPKTHSKPLERDLHDEGLPKVDVMSRAGETPETEETMSNTAATAPPKTMITTRDFSSWYGKFKALHELNLDIPERMVTALIGPSGCGKSTFLRWINRMNDTIAGARSIGRHDAWRRGHHRQPMRRGRPQTPGRHGLPATQSLSEVDLREHRLRREAAPQVHRGDLEQLVEHSLRQAAIWDEVKDRLKDSALGTLRRTAADDSASHERSRWDRKSC